MSKTIKRISVLMVFSLVFSIFSSLMQANAEAAATITALKANVEQVSVEKGKTIRLVENIKITANYSDGTSADVTYSADYKMVDSNIAKLPGNGNIEGVKEGITKLNAGYQGKQISVTVNVLGNNVASLAKLILQNKNISLLTYQPSGKVDGASAYDNIIDTANGKPAKRSGYGNAPGGTVSLSPTILKGILILANKYKFRVTSIAGASHSANSKHYLGTAFDIDLLNGQAAPKSSYRQSYVNDAKAVFGLIEATCIHLNW
jgi:hypothetical protein